MLQYTFHSYPANWKVFGPLPTAHIFCTQLWLSHCSLGPRTKDQFGCPVVAGHHVRALPRNHSSHSPHLAGRVPAFLVATRCYNRPSTQGLRMKPGSFPWAPGLFTIDHALRRAEIADFQRVALPIQQQILPHTNPRLDPHNFARGQEWQPQTPTREICAVNLLPVGDYSPKPSSESHPSGLPRSKSSTWKSHLNWGPLTVWDRNAQCHDRGQRPDLFKYFKSCDQGSPALSHPYLGWDWEHTYLGPCKRTPKGLVGMKAHLATAGTGTTWRRRHPQWETQGSKCRSPCL